MMMMTSHTIGTAIGADNIRTPIVAAIKAADETAIVAANEAAIIAAVKAAVEVAVPVQITVKEQKNWLYKL